MDRRSALKNLSIGLGGVAGSPMVLGLLASSTANAATWSADSFTAEEQHTVTQLVDIILPSSTTPGGLDVNVPQFLDKLFGQQFSELDRRYFRQGADLFANQFARVFSHPVRDGSRDEFARLLGGYFDLSDQEQARIFQEQARELAEIDPVDRDVYLTYKFLLSVRQNTLFGYFTSQQVGTEVLNYDPVPRSYDGCVPLSEIGNAWTF
jgi:hypothetical protein